MLPRALRAKTAGPLAVLAGCLTLCACSSIKTRIYDVDGVTSDERKIKCLKGIPTTIDVPTHVRITIEETRYFRQSGDLNKVGRSESPRLILTSATEPRSDGPTVADLKKQIEVLQAAVAEIEGTKTPATVADVNKKSKEVLDKIAELAKQLEKATPRAGPLATLPAVNSICPATIKSDTQLVSILALALLVLSTQPVIFSALKRIQWGAL